VDMNEFWKNRSQVPPEELEQYAGQYVAWSPDGTRVIAGDTDERRLEAAIKAAGYDPAEVVVSSVPPPDEVILGGGGMLP
jgi:hypothetical protein